MNTPYDADIILTYEEDRLSKNAIFFYLCPNGIPGILTELTEQVFAPESNAGAKPEIFFFFFPLRLAGLLWISGIIVSFSISWGERGK